MKEKNTPTLRENGHWQFDIDVSNMKFQNGIKALAKKSGGGIISEFDCIVNLYTPFVTGCSRLLSKALSV